MNEVNEVLFLWIAQIDESLDSAPDSKSRNHLSPDGDPVGKALDDFCEKALVWVEPREPLAGDGRVAEADIRPGEGWPPAAVADMRAIERNEPPGNVNREESALASFQWGVLAMRERRLGRAIDWLRRATQLESSNHWYQFFLAYLEDQAHATDQALSHYTAALALRPQSPWVRFSRAKIYRAMGQWDFALEDMKIALDMLSSRPEAARVHLEMGYLYYEVGDFASARNEYTRLIQLDGSGPFGPAARLNLANMDAESGAIERARQAYDDLLSQNLADTSARMSRALLELRMGQAERAFIDLSALLKQQVKPKVAADAMTARSLALMILGRPIEAIDDAVKAQRFHHTPALERLRQRAIMAARRLDLLQIDEPDTLALLPLGGRRLRTDVQAAAYDLNQLALSHPEETFRASLTLAVILAAQGQTATAIAAANRAIRVSPYAPRGYLIRARVRAFAGDAEGARADIAKGLSIQFNEPGLLELKGVLQARAGDYQGALELLDSASAWGALDRIHLHKAAALDALGRTEAAIQEWSLALRRDPELPEAYLGRARAHIKLRQWEMALANLEQAAAWAHSDPRIELEIAGAYFQCLAKHPDRLPRFVDPGHAPWRHPIPLVRSTGRSPFRSAPSCELNSLVRYVISRAGSVHLAISRPRSQAEIARGANRLETGESVRRTRDPRPMIHLGMRRGNLAISSGKSGPDVIIRPKTIPQAAFT